MAELAGAVDGVSRARAARCTCSAREEFLRWARHRRRAGSHRRRGRLRQPLSRRRPRVAHFLRRRRRQSGPGLRDLQHGGALAPARVFIVENNRYAMGTSVERSSAMSDFAKRGVAFNIPGAQVDGMDVRAVRAAAKEAIDWCRKGNGPYILEAQTYRYRGHSMSDPAKYRSKDEVSRMREEHDPIEQVRSAASDRRRGVAEAELKKLDAEARARSSPKPRISQRRTRSLIQRALHGCAGVNLCGSRNEVLLERRLQHF